MWTADTDEERARELSTAEWIEVVDQARALGTREWAISGGEPMLRDDFAEIFDYVTAKSSTYSLNTNGTLITPEIAQLLRRKGSKMVAVYGATAEVYDHVTRNPGGFEALLQGLAYLKEAGAGFTVQLIPMRDNWHQWDEMVAFAKSWSKQLPGRRAVALQDAPAATRGATPRSSVSGSIRPTSSSSTSPMWPPRSATRPRRRASRLKPGTATQRRPRPATTASTPPASRSAATSTWTPTAA